MTDHGSYTYDDSDRRLTIREMGGRVDIFVRDLDDSAMVLLPAEQRQAAAQALAGDGYRVVPADQIDAMSTDGRVRLYPSLPDRPAPVDPSEVRVGDYVAVESIDGITGVGPEWVMQGTIRDTSTGADGVVRSLGFDLDEKQATLWVDLIDATVRILRRAAPEPDPAAVGRLHDAICAVSGLGTDDALPLARALIRDHGVYVEVPDA